LNQKFLEDKIINGNVYKLICASSQKKEEKIYIRTYIG